MASSHDLFNSTSSSFDLTLAGRGWDIYTEPNWGGRFNVGLSFEILRNGSLLARVPLESEKGCCRIGRGVDSDIRVEHPSVELCHAVLQSSGDMGRMYLYDMQTVHRSKRNGRTVPNGSYVEVFVGDQIHFGLATRVFLLCGPEKMLPDEQDIQLCKLQRRLELASMKKRRKLLAVVNEDQDEDDEDDGSLFDPLTGRLDIIKLREKRKLSVKQDETVSKILEKMRKMDNLRSEKERLDTIEGDLTGGQESRLEQIDFRLQRLDEEIEITQESLADALGLQKEYKVIVSRQVREHFDNSLDDEDEDYFDRTKWSVCEKATKEGVSVEGILKEDVCCTDNEATLAIKCARLSSRKKELEQLIAKSEETLSKLVGVGQDPLEHFMRKNKTMLLKEATQRRQTEKVAVMMELQEADRFLALVRKGREREPLADVKKFMGKKTIHKEEKAKKFNAPFLVLDPPAVQVPILAIPQQEDEDEWHIQPDIGGLQCKPTTTS